MHAVKQIFFLLSVVAIASCGTMPVPGVEENSNNNSVVAVDTVPVSHKKSVNPNTPPTDQAARLHDVETSQKNKIPDTSYLSKSSDSQDFNDPTTTVVSSKQATDENHSRDIKIDNKSATTGNKTIDSTGVNNTNLGIKNESRQLDYIITDNGLIKAVPASAQTKASNQKPVPLNPINNNAKSDTNQDQEVRIQLALANRYYKSAKYQNAIDLLETPASKNKTNEKLRDLLLLSYTKYANELVNKANLLEAQTILEKAVSIEPKNTELQNQLKKVKNTREANRIYQLGVEAVNSGDNISAFKSFQKVLVLNPSHSMAKQQVAKIRAPVIESRYKEAMQHYRKQELTEAIQAWDDVLHMDPNHELAKLYRSRAVELKQKIDVIGKQ